MTTHLRLLIVLALSVAALCHANAAEPWKGNKIGISDTPPPPFTPMTVAMRGGSAKIGCWGRTYVLDDAGLPAQIRSRDADLLASPVRLIAESGGRDVEWKAIGFKLVKSSQAQVILEGSAQSRIGKLDWKCTAEYDGMLRYDLQIIPSPGAEVDKLELVFGVKPEHAQLMWLPGQYPTDRHGRLRPQSGGANWYTWLGDMDRGLAVFFETDEAWDNPNRGDAWRLEKRAGSVDHAWTFINGARPLDKPWKFTFGIEASPVKERTPGRKWLVASHLPVGPGNFVWPWPNKKTTKYFGYPEAVDTQKFRRMTEWYHKRGITVIPYVLLSLISSGAPELTSHPDWAGGIVDNDPERNSYGDGQDLLEVRPTQDYIDWMVWKCNKFVRENDLDGLYHDYTILMVLTDPAQGFGYIRDGKPVRCYPFFERRELQKRIYTMLKQYKKNALDIGHMSCELYLPYLTFCDVILNGENIGGVATWRKSQGFTSNTYRDIMTDDFIHSEVMGHNYGLTTIFMEMYSNLGIPEDHRYMVGLALLYDYSLEVIDGVKLDQRVYGAFREFGAMDAEYIPFWKLTNTVRGQTDEVRCSAYRKRNGGTVLVIFNKGKDAHSLTLTVDWPKLKAKRDGPVEVRDVLPAGWGELVDNELPVNGSQITIDVPAGDFRLLTVQ